LTPHSESEYDADLAFQLFDGEVMDADFANFVGIHMMRDMIQPRQQQDE
jgi:hypothetical protein